MAVALSCLLRRTWSAQKSIVQFPRQAWPLDYSLLTMSGSKTVLLALVGNVLNSLLKNWSKIVRTNFDFVYLAFFCPHIYVPSWFDIFIYSQCWQIDTLLRSKNHSWSLLVHIIITMRNFFLAIILSFVIVSLTYCFHPYNLKWLSNKLPQWKLKMTNSRDYHILYTPQER